jgi:hypothetical protein
MTAPQGAMISPGNDSRHNLTDDNHGGSPRGGFGTKKVAPAQRGGFGHNGRDIVAQRAKMTGGRSGSGNPASRGGSVQHETAQTQVRGHGGSPQGASRMATAHQFGKSGQQGVPTGRAANPQPSSGNTSGRSYRLIAGRFKRAAMGARATGGRGSYGGNPVSANT